MHHSDHTGVDDLERSLEFYRDGLGLSTQGIVGTEFEQGAVAFFDLQPGLKLAIWPRDDIAHDAHLAKTAHSPTECTIGHNVDSRGKVDEVMDQARTAGAMIVGGAEDTFWGGYSSYFQDPDGHLWEIVWNPQFETSELRLLGGTKQTCEAANGGRLHGRDSGAHRDASSPRIRPPAPSVRCRRPRCDTAGGFGFDSSRRRHSSPESIDHPVISMLTSTEGKPAERSRRTRSSARKSSIDGSSLAARALASWTRAWSAATGRISKPYRCSASALIGSKMDASSKGATQRSTYQSGLRGSVHSRSPGLWLWYAARARSSAAEAP